MILSHSFKLCLLFLASLYFQSCILSEDEPPEEFVPITIPRAEFESSVKLEGPKPLGTTGKIYVKDSFLFINEKNEGFHIFDNSDPSNPKPLHFLKAIGSTDLAIRGTTLFINQAVDLISVEYDNTDNSINVSKRIVNVFPKLPPPNGVLVNGVNDGELIIGYRRIKLELL